jgi:hypothetical protein
MEDRFMDLGDVNRENLTYVLQGWLKAYFETDIFEEYWRLELKILDAMRMKIEGREILSKRIIDDLEEAFRAYTTAKMELEKERHEYTDFDHEEKQLEGYRQGIKRTFQVAIWNLKQHLI